MPRAGAHAACPAAGRRPQPQNAATPPPSGAWQRPSRSGAPVVQSFPRPPPPGVRTLVASGRFSGRSGLSDFRLSDSGRRLFLLLDNGAVAACAWRQVGSAGMVAGTEVSLAFHLAAGHPEGWKSAGPEVILALHGRAAPDDHAEYRAIVTEHACRASRDVDTVKASPTDLEGEKSSVEQQPEKRPLARFHVAAGSTYPTRSRCYPRLGGSTPRSGSRQRLSLTGERLTGRSSPQARQRAWKSCHRT